MGKRRFLAAIQGERGEVSRLGNADSGIEARAQGWEVGVKIVGRVIDGEDVFHIYANKGSNGGTYSEFLGSVKLEDGVPVFLNGR